MAKKTKDTVTEYIEATKQALIDKYGTIKGEWLITIMMLEDNLRLYKEVKDSIYKVGIWNDQRQVKNPLLSTLKDLQAVIMKLTVKLGITPYDEGRIKAQEAEEETDFIDSLIND